MRERRSSRLPNLGGELSRQNTKDEEQSVKRVKHECIGDADEAY